MGNVIGMAGHNSDESEMDQTAVMVMIEEIEEEQAKIDDVNAVARETNGPQREQISKIKKRLREDHSVESKAISIILAKRRQSVSAVWAPRFLLRVSLGFCVSLI